MPPLRRVSNCSPSARARTVTAHSLKAIGMFSWWGEGRDLLSVPGAHRERCNRSNRSLRLYELSRKSQNVAANQGILRADFVTRPVGSAYEYPYGWLIN